MAFFDSTVRATGSTFAGRLAHLLTRPASVFSDWNDRRITRNALSKLTDYELLDIGLTRADVNAL